MPTAQAAPVLTAQSHHYQSSVQLNLITISPVFLHVLPSSGLSRLFYVSHTHSNLIQTPFLPLALHDLTVLQSHHGGDVLQRHHGGDVLQSHLGDTWLDTTVGARTCSSAQLQQWGLDLSWPPFLLGVLTKKILYIYII